MFESMGCYRRCKEKVWVMVCVCEGSESCFALKKSFLWRRDWVFLHNVVQLWIVLKITCTWKGHIFILNIFRLVSISIGDNRVYLMLLYCTKITLMCSLTMFQYDSKCTVSVTLLSNKSRIV